eukprot:1660838-Pleurochrysis_carterae.AAC.1
MQSLGLRASHYLAAPRHSRLPCDAWCGCAVRAASSAMRSSSTSTGMHCAPRVRLLHATLRCCCAAAALLLRCCCAAAAPAGWADGPLGLRSDCELGR